MRVKRTLPVGEVRCVKGSSIKALQVKSSLNTRWKVNVVEGDVYGDTGVARGKKKSSTGAAICCDAIFFRWVGGSPHRLPLAVHSSKRGSLHALPIASSLAMLDHSGCSFSLLQTFFHLIHSHLTTFHDCCACGCWGALGPAENFPSQREKKNS